MADAPGDRRGSVADAPYGIRGELSDPLGHLGGGVACAADGVRGHLLGAPESLGSSLADASRNVTCALADLGRGMDIFLLLRAGWTSQESHVNTQDTLEPGTICGNIRLGSRERRLCTGDEVIHVIPLLAEWFTSCT